ncbi:hypothetical protein [Aeromonas sobria]|uniref:hypothetical protein n=1 Tax=Aeromonas sobria TaxID=646 RepID=UPI000C6DEF00|nr:hypothetical protein [Aeromonas sobria]PKQ78109.1 hypothetical protein CJF47_07455 [Aeromonas sobria]
MIHRLTGKYINCIETLQNTKYDQYQALLFVIDEMLGTNYLDEITNTPELDINQSFEEFKKATGANSIMEFLEATHDEILPVLATLGDIVVVQDPEGHDDIAFGLVGAFLIIEDVFTQSKHLISDIAPEGKTLKAFRLEV